MRARVSVALLVVAVVLLSLGGIVLYANQVAFDSDRFADRATSTLGHSEVRQLIARRVTNELIEAKPDLIAARPLVESVVDGVVGSQAFQSLFRGGVLDLHRSVFDRDRNTVTLAVGDVAVLAVEALRNVAPQIARQIPENVQTDLVDLSGGMEERLAQASRVADGLHDLALFLLLAAAVLAALAIGLAPDRRRAVTTAGGALVVAGVLVAVGHEVARAIVTGLPNEPDQRDAARAVWDVFLSDLRTWALLLAVAGVIVVAVARSLVQPQPIGPLLRRGWEIVAETPESKPLRALRAVAFLAVGIVLLAAPQTALRLAVYAIGLLVAYVGAAELFRVFAGPPRAIEPEREEAPAARPRRGRTRLAIAAIAVFALAGLGGVALAAGLGGEEEAPFELEACNGHAELCDRPLDQIAFPATHNSMAGSTEPGWLFASQEDGIAEQLQAGVRALLIDTHYGVETPKGVATDLQRKSKSRAKIEDELGTAFVDTAERLRGRLGFKGGGKREVFLCHAYCEVGATRAVDALRDVRDFMLANPGEVLIISIEDDVTPESTAEVFEESGLLDLVWRGPIDPLPTPREMIEAGQPVLVMGEEDTGDVPWFHQQFETVQETPFHFESPEQLLRPGSCSPNRGGPGSPMLLVNHWVDTSPAPRPTNAKRVNAREELLGRVRLCRRVRQQLPNLVAVDFYKRGDLMGVVDRLNGVR